MTVAQAQDVIQKSIDALQKSNKENFVSKEDSKLIVDSIKGLESQLEALKGLDKSKDITAIYDKLNDIEALVNGGAATKESFYDQVEKEIDKNIDAIKQVLSNRAGTVALKAVDTVTTNNATVPNGFPDIVGVQIAPPDNARLVDVFIDAFVSYENTNKDALTYTETVPKDGDFQFIAEGTKKPQVDLEFVTNSVTSKKIAGYVKLTEESVDDIPRLMSIIRDLLRKKHDLARQKAILFGDGTGANPKGATKYGRLFKTTKFANNKVQHVNMLDIVNAMFTDIYTEHTYEDETPFRANLVLMNNLDFFSMIASAKTLDGTMLYPTASLFNQVTIGGMLIRAYEHIPQGKIFCADMSRYNVTTYKPYSIRIGYDGEDFLKNMFCVLGESRMHAYVKRLDEQAFIYDDIDNIKNAISAPDALAVGN